LYDECDFRGSPKPVAICKEAVAIFINPSGIEDYVLEPLLLDDGSFDNCAIDSMAVEPAVFDCSQAGSTIDVKFFVWDAFGNVDSCMTSVKVETQVLTPSYQAGVCAFDTLKLFSNLPDAPEGIYTILWTKDNNGFSSNDKDPVRPNADASYSGTYTLEVTGLDGCFSTGFVEVFIEDLTTPELAVSRDTVCAGESVILETNNYSGNVIYKWYEGVPPNGILIDSSFVPSYELQASTGLHDYYVQIISENCISLPSQKNSLLVLATPNAVVNDPFLNLCEGDDIVLGTSVSGAGYTYRWWGPDSYISTDQNPQIIESVKIINQGTYRLAVFNGICSDTAQVEVLVNERPIRPEITSDSIYCEDEIMVLSVGNITNADLYAWYIDGGLYTVENSNTLVIPEAQSIFAGEWQVVAKEGNCYSDTSVVKNIDVELRFEISASNSGPVCEGDSVKLFAPELEGASYLWIGPENDSIQEARPIIPAKKGFYSLEIITSSGCRLDATTEVEVVRVPEITALSNTAPDCISGSECIKFKPSVFPNLGNYTYSWTGPNDFTSSDSIAVMCQAATSQNGIYSLVVSNGICASEIATTEVEMYDYPLQAELFGPIQVCETDTLIISAENEYDGNNDFYWRTPGGNVYQTNDATLVLPQAITAYTGYYSLQVFNGHCYSQPSDSVFVEVLKKPNQPVAWTQNAFCEGDPINLFTNYVDGGEYFWEGPNGFTSAVQNPVIFPSDTLSEGIYRVSVSLDGCLSEISEAVVVNIIRKPNTPEIVGGLDPICLADPTTSFELCLENQDPDTEYTWYHNESGKSIAESFSSCIEIANLQGVIDGENGFYVVAESQGCSSDLSPLMYVTLNLVPAIQADAGQNIISCYDNDLYLDATGNDSGTWTTLESGVQIEEPMDPKTAIFNLNEGDNSFIWSLSHGVCYDYDRDSVIVHIIPTPVAVDDSYQTGYDQNIDIEPILNDLYADQAIVLIDAAAVSYGVLEDTGFNSFEFDPSPEYVGEVFIPYKLQHNECVQKTSTAFIKIKISEADDCFGVNVITPNGDGVNDELRFPCLENPLFPLNKLTVFNQWGDEVYSASPYGNDWTGTFRGKDLPVGTYYYILDLRNGSEPIKDFVVIER
jgi:gliding motility-associated-like protein